MQQASNHHGPAPIDAVTEIHRLKGDIADFDRDIANLEARCRTRPRPWDRIQLSAVRSARWSTQQALEEWMRRVATASDERTPLIH